MPPNMKLSGMIASWNGFVKGKGQLARTYGTSMNSRQIHNRIMKLDSPDGKYWQVTDNLMYLNDVSGCNGGDINIRINSNIKITSPSS